MMRSLARSIPARSHAGQVAAGACHVALRDRYRKERRAQALGR